MRGLTYAIVAVLASGLSALVRADHFPHQVLETPTFRVTITERCKDGDLECANVEYVGVNKKTNESVRLKGARRMVLCADGVTPCHLGSYVFHSGPYTYLVYPQGELAILKGDEIVISEKGVWIAQDT